MPVSYNRSRIIRFGRTRDHASEHLRPGHVLCVPHTVTAHKIGPTEGPLRRAAKIQKGKRQNCHHQAAYQAESTATWYVCTKQAGPCYRSTVPALKRTTTGQEPSPLPDSTDEAYTNKR